MNQANLIHPQSFFCGKQVKMKHHAMFIFKQSKKDGLMTCEVIDGCLPLACHYID